MPNSILTNSVITKEALRILKNNLAFTAGVSRKYEDRFGIAGAKIGDTVNARKPARYVGSTGRVISAFEDHTETSVPVQLTTQFKVAVQFTSQEMLLNLDAFSDRVLKPAVATIANKVDADGLALYKKVFNSIGTPGTVPATAKLYLQAGQKLDESSCPVDGLRSLVVNPAMQVEIVDALKGLFQDSSKVAQQYRSGRMGIGLGFDWSMDQNVNTHTVGPLGGTPAVAGASQTGASLATSGWTAAAAARLKVGDVFTIANVFRVNAQTRQSIGVLQQFVVTADFSSAADGTGSVSISPPITVTGAFQTVNASPADGALITVVGAANATSPQGLAYHRDAFTLVTADLPQPNDTTEHAIANDPDSGLSIRFVRQYDITNDLNLCRIDILYGWAALYPELACRIQS